MNATNFRPSLATTEPSITTPVLIAGQDLDGSPIIFLQWFGSCYSGFGIFGEGQGQAEKAFKEAQFRFPIHSDPNGVYWMGHPENFQVVSIGQAKDWPNQQAASAFGDPETWILYVASTFFRINDQPAAYVVPLQIFLADPLYGVIMPAKFSGPLPN